MIVALAALAITMILLLALFVGTTHQTRGAQNDTATAREKMLADSAAALVIGQIQQASTQAGQAWISQPGLLRTYGVSAMRTPSACYKLYSTPQLADMTDTSGTVNFLGTDIPANWSSSPNLYTDLNAPTVTSSGNTIYPILDPAALTNAANQTAGTQVTGVSSDLYNGSGTNAVAMPVAWLYELQDGTLGPASKGTAANPIVARMAFWTDDETSKININTAGCAAPWNTPRVNSTDDVAWSTRQPASGEFTAYPGHPATTTLATVFGANCTPQQLLGLTPRYAYGGSQLGTQTTTAGESVPAKTDRLYGSLDELCFSTNMASGQRVANPVTAAQLEQAQFVLTAHSEAPETTLLGEPRVAIWPVADSTTTSAPRITATDRAIMSDATVGTGTASVRNYYFQRNNPMNTKDDFDPSVTGSAATSSNVELFNDLVKRGTVNQPGYGASLSAKYPDPAWTQILLEITDFIHGINAVDPSPAPFVPFTGNGSGIGFVEPLTWAYGSGASAVTLRGFGRCPTLSSLTLVFYVCGFKFDSTATASLGVSSIDFDTTPDASGSFWTTNLSPSSAIWQHVTAELVRAFVVPCTFQPGCGFPEVSDSCSLQISGLNAISLTSATSNDFGFTSPLTSRVLSDALQVAPADRAWGGNEGPLAWRAAALDAKSSGAFTYAFAGTKAMAVTLPTKPSYNAATKVLTWPHLSTLLFHAPSGQTTYPLTVTILDTGGNTLQTLAVNLPANVGVPAPVPTAEYALNDAGSAVQPSYFMTLRNRALATQSTREFLIQPGDTSRSVEAATDLRVIASLPNVPASMFQPHPAYSTLAQAHAHNLHFADGTAVYGASGFTTLAGLANYAAATTTLSWTDWTKAALTTYAWPISARNDCFTTSTADNSGVVLQPGIPGDWDTGPGFAPDGAQINLPDSGTTLAPATAYQSLAGGQVGAATQRTPNALVPSPVIFGSLPTRINPAQPTQSVPWCTLLFCPFPLGGSAHPGFGNASSVPPVAPDHLVFDNFWMPVVEPYAISTCMATAGKINLNDQIAPFTYLHRNTALHALLNNLRIPAISLTQASAYKSPGTALPTIWNAVDENATIAQIENRFANGSADAYLSESEICTVPLVPQGQASDNVADTQTALASFWQGQSTPDGGLTGDNLRELPYAQLYSRLTTRSNSYTVHMRVQVLQKLTRDPNQNVWNEGVDRVIAIGAGRMRSSAISIPPLPRPWQAPRWGLINFAS